MNNQYIEDKIYEKKDFTTHPPPQADYDYCKFIQCDISNVDLSGCRFTDCEFLNCNLTLAKLNKTVFRDCKFDHCKMNWLVFDSSNDLGLSFNFQHCLLHHSSFYGAKIKKTNFIHCELVEADFTGADLSGAVFDQSILRGTRFEQTNLETADFRKALEFSIDPRVNRLKKAKFSMHGLAGLLEPFGIIVE